MHAEISYKGGFTFETKIRDHTFNMDTQISAGGKNTGPTPKELLIAAIIGCAAMDVVAMFKKHQMTADSFTVAGDAEPRREHPRIFEGVDVVFEATGGNVSAEVFKEAVQLSLTKFCGVSAMVNSTSPIKYRLVLNKQEIAVGAAAFPS